MKRSRAPTAILRAQLIREEGTCGGWVGAGGEGERVPAEKVDRGGRARELVPLRVACGVGRWLLGVVGGLCGCHGGRWWVYHSVWCAL